MFTSYYTAKIVSPSGTSWVTGLTTGQFGTVISSPIYGNPPIPRADFVEYFYSSEPTDPPPGPASVTLTPPNAVNPVGTSHTVTATVNNAAGGPVQDSSVLFNVQGSVTTSGSCTTNASGQCSFTYAGPLLPGADIITGCADSNSHGTANAGEPCGQATKAWVLPTSTPGQVTGGGQLPVTGTGQIAFGFTAQNTNNGVKGECTVVDTTGADTKIKCTDATVLVQSATQATFFGNATINGVATTYRIDVTDNGEPGADHDTFAIHTASGYSASGTIAKGNIQIH